MWIVELNKKGFSPISIGAYDDKEDAERYINFNSPWFRRDWTVNIYQTDTIANHVFYTPLPEDTNEDTIMEYLNPDKNYSVIMRTKHSSTEDWDYSNELCTTKVLFDGILWLIDWDEGQKYVDFLAFAEISGGDFK